MTPISLYGGTREILWPDAQKFTAMAKEQNVGIDYREWEGMNLCFCLYPIPEAVKVQDEIIGMLHAFDKLMV